VLFEPNPSKPHPDHILGGHSCIIRRLFNVAR
jgi:hypothetical protein